MSTDFGDPQAAGLSEADIQSNQFNSWLREPSVQDSTLWMNRPSPSRSNENSTFVRTREIGSRQDADGIGRIIVWRVIDTRRPSQYSPYVSSDRHVISGVLDVYQAVDQNSFASTCWEFDDERV